MSRIFVTGSTEGLGLATARALMEAGHDVVLHARSARRAEVLSGIAPRAAGVVIGDLSVAAETQDLARQVNALGRMHAVIHNAGIFGQPERETTPDGHAQVLATNTLAPYLLTALLERPARLVFLSSGMHRTAPALEDMEWITRRWDRNRAYSESKLYLTTLALAIARHWPQVLSHAVDPGWVPTRMGGPDAPDDLTEGHLTQVWLATSEDPDVKASGGYWHHRARRQPAAETQDPEFQDRLMDKLAALTGLSLF